MKALLLYRLHVEMPSAPGYLHGQYASITFMVEAQNPYCTHRFTDMGLPYMSANRETTPFVDSISTVEFRLDDASVRCVFIRADYRYIWRSYTLGVPHHSLEGHSEYVARVTGIITSFHRLLLEWATTSPRVQFVTNESNGEILSSASTDIDRVALFELPEYTPSDDAPPTPRDNVELCTDLSMKGMSNTIFWV